MFLGAAFVSFGLMSMIVCFSWLLVGFGLVGVLQLFGLGVLV